MSLLDANEEAMSELVEAARLWRHCKMIFICSETIALRAAVDKFEVLLLAYVKEKRAVTAPNPSGAKP